MSFRTYECSVKGEEWSRQIVAETASKARYEYLMDLRESWPDVQFKHITVRSCGAQPPRTSERLLRVADNCGLPFVRAGMRVEVDGQPGIIVDGNDSSNFDVMFTDGPQKGQVGNCHPWWRMKYFDREGNVVRECHG